MQARDTKAIKVPIADSSFREIKRHWIIPGKITKFEITDKTLADFHNHVLSDGYSAYISEEKDLNVFKPSTTEYYLVYERS